MGKVILTERQYKNLKRNLISKSINESNNQKKRILNEVGYFNNWIDVDFVNLTLTLNKYLEFERANTGGSELKLNAGVVFTRIGGVNSKLVAKNTPFQLVGDYTGGVEENATGTVTYYCQTKNLDIAGRSALFVPENLAPETKQGFLDLCNQKPAAVPVTTTTTTVAKSTAPLIDFNNPTTENIIAFQRWYWSVKEKDLKLISGDVDDICKAKYASALCGGRPCIRTQAVDGKSGGNTNKLMTPELTQEFLNWKNANPTKLAEYSKLDTCSSAQKGYTNPNPKPKTIPKSTPKTIPVNTGGGGQRTNIAAPTGYEQSLK